MKQLLKQCAGLVLLFLATCTLTACKERSATVVGPREKITIASATHQPTTTLVQVAANRGYFAEEGLDVSIQPHEYGKTALTAMLDGKADLATSAEIPVMFAIMNGRKLAIHASIATSDSDHGLLTRKDSGIRIINDLRGKRIGLTPGTSGQYFLGAVLTNAGLDETDVVIVPLTPAEMPKALLAGSVDAVAIWNFSLAEMKNEAGTILVKTDKTFYSIFFCLTSRQEFARSHPDALRKVMKALVKAEAFTKSNPEEVKRTIAPSFGVDAKLVAGVWKDYAYETTLNQALLIILQDEARWAMNKKLVPSAQMPVFLEYFDATALTAVKPDAVRLIR